MTGGAPSETGTARYHYGWVVVGATFVVLFFGFGAAYSFGAFFVPLQTEFGAARGETSLVFSIAGSLFFFLGIVSGRLSDRFGVRPVAAFGVVCAGAGLIASGMAETLTQVYLAFGLGIGFGVGFSYVTTVGTVQRWFVRRRGLASGFAVAGIGAGTVAMPIAAAALIEAWDWRTAYISMGIATLVCGLAAAAFLVHSPERGARPSATGEGMTAAEAIRTRPFLLIFTGYLFSSFGNFVPLVHLVPYAADRGIDAPTGALLLGLIGVGSTAGRFVLGGLADRFGRKRSLAVAFAGIGVSALWWLASDSVWQLAVFALVMGTCYGGYVALGPAVVADYFGTRHVSAILGAIYTGAGVGMLFGPTLAGLAYDALRSYTLPIAGCAAAALGAGLMVFLAEDPARFRAARERAAREEKE